MRWYASFESLSTYDLIFVAPSHLRRAEIYDRLGDDSRAAEHYARFVDLWRHADPDLRPMVDSAKQRLSRLRDP